MVKITRILFLFCLLSGAGHELIAQRVAWVVGNSEYVDGVLPNPVNDAQLVSDSLAALGFEVRLDKNLATYNDFWSSWDELEPDIQDAEIFLFYYAGHGIQYENENYLIPTEAELQDERRIGNECFPIKSLINEYEKFTDSTAFVVVLDACRVNPFERKWSRSYGGGAGLSKVNPPTGTLVAYSTEYGTTAADGSGMYSAYAEAFAKLIGEPGRSLQESFQTIRKTVLELSQKRQVPVEENKLTERLVLRQLPDISMVEFQNILDDFEELLIRGFKENALIIPDTAVGVEAAYQLVSYYANEKVELDSNTLLRFAELTFYNELYRLQSGVISASEYPGFKSVLKDREVAPDLLSIGYEFLSLLEVEEAAVFLSLKELELLDIQNAVLVFSAMSGVKPIESTFTGLTVDYNNDGSLMSVFLQCELVKAVEAFVETERYGQVVEEMSSEAIIDLMNQYYDFYADVSSQADLAYANSISFMMLVQAIFEVDSKSGGKALEKYVRSKAFKTITAWLETPIDYESQVSTEVLERYLVAACETLISSAQEEQMKEALLQFFDREWARSYKSCSGSYVDLMDVLDDLVEIGYAELLAISPTKQAFSDSLLNNWSCFVAEYLGDQDLNDLHFTVSLFLENQWILVEDDFSKAEISRATWLELLEAEMNLLRLTNRVPTCDFSDVAGMKAAESFDNWDSKELLSYAQEIWRYLRIGKELSEELDVLDYEERVLCLYDNVLHLIKPVDLDCLELDGYIKLLLEIISVSLDEEELKVLVPACMVLMDAAYEVKAIADCLSRESIYSSTRKHHWKILEELRALNDEGVYPLTNTVKGDYQEAMAQAGNYDKVIQLEILDFRLKSGGFLTNMNVLGLMDSIHEVQQEFNAIDEYDELEYFVIYQLYSLVSDISIEYGFAHPDSSVKLVEASQQLLSELEILIRSGSDSYNRAEAAFWHANGLQDYYHRMGDRYNGAKDIVQAARLALKLMEDDWQIQQLNYLLCEELSCAGEFDEAIFFRSLCLSDTSETWEQEDLWQFAQDQFIDEILSGNSAASNFEELWTAPELEDFDITQTQCLVEQHNGCHQIAIVDFPEGALPLIEISKSSLEPETAMILQTEGKGWVIAKLGEEFEFIGNRTDSLYSVCHTAAQGFVLPEKPDEFGGVDVWENHNFNGGNRVTSLRIPEALFEAGGEVSRIGFYIKNPLPTGHTQDLKYITYMRSVD